MLLPIDTWSKTFHQPSTIVLYHHECHCTSRGSRNMKKFAISCEIASAVWIWWRIEIEDEKCALTALKLSLEWLVSELNKSFNLFESTEKANWQISWSIVLNYLSWFRGVGTADEYETPLFMMSPCIFAEVKNGFDAFIMWLRFQAGKPPNKPFSSWGRVNWVQRNGSCHSIELLFWIANKQASRAQMMTFHWSLSLRLR